MHPIYVFILFLSSKVLATWQMSKNQSPSINNIIPEIHELHSLNPNKNDCAKYKIDSLAIAGNMLSQKG